MHWFFFAYRIIGFKCKVWVQSLADISLQNLIQGDGCKVGSEFDKNYENDADGECSKMFEYGLISAANF